MHQLFPFGALQLVTNDASLTGDPQYNMTLGSAHLADLVNDFGGSYVLAIASYNAGSHRAREWIAESESGGKNYRRMLKADMNHPIERVGGKLRARMPWLKEAR